jgi:alanine-glyoxylate transaminase/(R)-3-amino-2-methylpropionate-pyruvate transaminase
MSCAAGRAVLRAIDEDQTQRNAKDVGDCIKSRLQDLETKYDLIGDIRGCGLMIGVELVKDRIAKEPASEETARISEAAKEEGVIIGQGGVMGNVLRINPPLCIQKEDVDFFVDVLNHCFSKL